MALIWGFIVSSQVSDRLKVFVDKTHGHGTLPGSYEAVKVCGIFNR